MATRPAAVRARSVVSQPDAIKAEVRTNSQQSGADGRMDALYRFCRDLQGNQLVALVCLVTLGNVVEPDEPDRPDQPDKPDEPQVLGLPGRLCLLPFELGPAVIEPFCSCTGCVQRFGSFL